MLTGEGLCLIGSNMDYTCQMEAVAFILATNFVEANDSVKWIFIWKAMWLQ